METHCDVKSGFSSEKIKKHSKEMPLHKSREKNYDLKANFTKIIDPLRVSEMLGKFGSEREGRKGFSSPKMVVTIPIKP